MADKHNNDERVFWASNHQVELFKQQSFQTMYQHRKAFSPICNSRGFSRVNHVLGNKNLSAQDSFHYAESVSWKKENREPENNISEKSFDPDDVIDDRTVPQLKQRKYSSRHTSQKLSEIFSQNLLEEKYEISDDEGDLADVWNRSFARIALNKLLINSAKNSENKNLCQFSLCAGSGREGLIYDYKQSFH